MRLWNGMNATVQRIARNCGTNCTQLWNEMNATVERNERDCADQPEHRVCSILHDGNADCPARHFCQREFVFLRSDAAAPHSALLSADGVCAPFQKPQADNGRVCTCMGMGRVCVWVCVCSVCVCVGYVYG